MVAFAFFATFATAFAVRAFFVLAEAGATGASPIVATRKRDRATGAEGQECGYEQCRQT
jgi:hypothetical protein